MKSNSNRIHADDGFDAEFVRGARFEGTFQFPCIEAPDKIIIPDCLVPLSKIGGNGSKKTFAVEYEYDNYFAKLTRSPRIFIDALRSYGGFISADNSVYLNAPIAVQIANLYRNRMTGYYMQSNGIYTVANFRGGSEAIYTNKFFESPPAMDGLPHNSIIAVSPYGCVKNREERKHFEASLFIMLDCLHPKVVLVYSHGADKILKTLRHKTQFVVYNDWISIRHGKEAYGIWL